MTPHKHAEVIKAWADGAAIEFRYSQGDWKTSKDPNFLLDIDYRIKPEPPAKAYPVTLMKIEDYNNALSKSRGCVEIVAAADIANAAIRHAIDVGQVVTVEDHQAALDRLGRSLRDVEIARHPMRDMAVALAIQSVCVSAVAGPAERRKILDIDIASITASVG